MAKKKVHLKIEQAEYCGFCSGVRRAVKLAEDAVRESPQSIYSIGPIIHNKQEVERLREKGINVIKSILKMNSGTLIIRSHGISSDELKKTRERGISIVDATCPFVRKVHRIVKLLKKQGYEVVVIGEKKHPEVLSLKGVKVVEKKEDVSKIKRVPKLGVVSQTTQTVKNFNEVVQALLQKAPELRVFNTICHETVKRQEAARKLAQLVDCIFVIGGYNSANTRRITEICKETGTETHHIETVDEIKPHWLKGKKKIGITAGASTPAWLIEELIKELKTLAPKVAQ